MTLAEKTITVLASAGLDARKPANYVGGCKSSYIVVQDAGAQPMGKSTCRRTVVLYGYAPYNQPALLADMLATAKAVMAAMPALRLTMASEETVDDACKALTANLTYTALCAK